MAQPPRYERKKDFAEDYGDNTDHVALNAELDGAAQSINATRANLALMQRDDGALKNGIVTADSLSASLLGDIVTAVSGDIDDKVQQATAAATDSVNASINSQNSAASSQNYAEQSLASAGSAQANAQASAASRDRAQEWAEKLGSPVQADQFSAHHWANQAREWAAGPAESISVVPNEDQPETNVQTAIDRLAAAAVDYADRNGDGTQDFAVASLNGGQLAGMRNKIINGAFQIKQRPISTAGLPAGAYAHDRWKAGSGGCTYSVSTANNITTVNITSGTLVQVIDGLNLLSGINTLSWQGTAQGRINGGAYGASGIQALATGGTNIQIEFGVGTLALVQLEAGEFATPFEHRPITIEHSLAFRYFYRLASEGATLSHIAVGQAAGTSGVAIVLHLPVAMRTPPTITAINLAAYSPTLSGAFTLVTNAALIGAGNRSCYLYSVGSESFTDAGRASVVVAGNNGSIQFDAELQGQNYV